MVRVPIILIASAAALSGCGNVGNLKPAPGQPLPVKPLMARTTPTPEDLLAIPSYAKPGRVDELMRRSEPRSPDPFSLPPPSGAAAPSLPAGSESQPDPLNDTSPAPGMPVTPPRP